MVISNFLSFLYMIYGHKTFFLFKYNPEAIIWDTQPMFLKSGTFFN